MRNPNAAVLIVWGLVCLSMIWLIVTVFRPWLQARRAGQSVALHRIIGMQFRGTSPPIVVEAYLALVGSGYEISLGDVERAYLLKKASVKSAADLVQIVRGR